MRRRHDARLKKKGKRKKEPSAAAPELMTDVGVHRQLARCAFPSPDDIVSYLKESTGLDRTDFSGSVNFP